MAQHYLFGDTQRAAQRLHRLADVYDPFSRETLADHAPQSPRLALDVGAGIGRTTRLVHDVVRATRTVGLDTSERFLELAREEQGSAAVEFLRHDVTALPYPTAPAELLFSRFLLTHLAEPRAALATFRAAAAPEAVLVCEETASLESAHPALARYYELVEAMQAHYGQKLGIGRDLSELAEAAGWSVLEGGIRPLALSSAAMAELHAMNITTWSRDPFAQAQFDAAELVTLERTLVAIADGTEPAPPVACGFGWVVARRA
jgi:trans-aconitate 2-methyltransferase